MTTRNHTRPTSNERGDRALYAAIRAIPPLIVRVDGRNFRQLLRDGFEKPFDERFAKGLADSAVIFFEQSGFDPKLAYLFSDEINLYFTHVPFKGRIEKLDSVIAGFFASALTLMLQFNEPLSFDARIIPVCSGDDVLEYLTQRQAEAWRNHLNAYGYYGLQAYGLGDKEAEQRLRGMKAAQVHELLFRHGINLNETPTWQRRGVVVAKERFEKGGYNPKTAKGVFFSRYKIVQLWDLPLFGSAEGRELIARLIGNENLS